MHMRSLSTLDGKGILKNIGLVLLSSREFI